MPARAIPRPIRSFTALREPSSIMSAASVYPNGVMYFRNDAGSAIFAMMFMKYSSSASPRPMPNPFPLTCNVGNCLNALSCSYDSCSKSFWDSPLVEGPGRQVYPKTTTFCLVLGFTPSRQLSRAHQSQNDLEQRYSGTFVALSGGLYGTVRPVFHSRFS